MSTNRLFLTLLVVATAVVPAPPRDPALVASAVSIPDRPTVSCAACLVALGDDVIWGREIDTRRANASTTKMVTALVVVRAAGLAEAVEVSRNAAATGGGGLDLRPGGGYTAGELLHALLLTSSNDAAVALAEHVAGSETAFVARMNAVARSLGARSSRFVTSHGLDVTGHYSSARDLARIALAVLRRPVLAAIVRTRSVTISGPSGAERLVNTNPLLESYPGAIGVKTGYTSGAGDVLVAAAIRRGRRLVAVAMGSTDAAADATALLDYGFAVLGEGVLVEEGAPVGTLVFDPSGAVGVVAESAVRGLPERSTVQVEFEPEPSLAAPLAEGETVGTVVVISADGEVVGRAPAVAEAAVPDAGAPPGASLLGGLLRGAAAIFGGRSW